MGPNHPEPSPSLLFKHPSQREKKILFLFFLEKKKILILMHLLLLFSLIYFHVISFVICNNFMSIYIIFCLIVIIILFLWCIKCIYVSWPCETPLLSWARSALKGVFWSFGLWQTRQEQKHWVTKCHLDFFFPNVFTIHFYIVAIVCVFLFWLLFFFFFPNVTNDQLLSVNAKLSVGESLSSLRKHFPWFHGLTDSMTGGASLRRLSDGYFYINLPPIFMCLLSGCVEKSVRKKTNKKKEQNVLFYFDLLLFSLTKNTWPQRASLTVNHDVR